MANSPKQVVSATVSEIAADMTTTWDSALNWAATAEALIDVIVAIGGQVDPAHFGTLIGAAAMARRQSFQAAPESEVLS